MEERQKRKSSLADKECVPCKGEIPPLASENLARLLEELNSGWRVVDGHHLEREFRFKNFRQAMDFANAIAGVAEEQQHHPELRVGWGRLGVTLFTHVINGLHENDFILAARIDALPRS